MWRRRFPRFDNKSGLKVVLKQRVMKLADRTGASWTTDQLAGPLDELRDSGPATYFVDEPLPRRLMRQDDVIGAVETYEPRIAYLACHQQVPAQIGLERHDGCASQYGVART